MTKEYKPTLRERALEQKRKANERVAKHIEDREEKFKIKIKIKSKLHE